MFEIIQNDRKQVLTFKADHGLERLLGNLVMNSEFTNVKFSRGIIIIHPNGPMLLK